jgi:hypothetical protein
MMTLSLPSIQDLRQICIRGEINSCELSTFQWNWGEYDEPDSYQNILLYLASNGISVHVIGNGETLPDQLLYKVDVYSLRPRSKLHNEEYNKSYDNLIKKFTVSGRSDLIRLRENLPSKIHRLNTEYVIEVKTVKNMKGEALTKEALRESCIELVGLNIDNPYISPAVILTNLSGKNYVLYITLNDNHQEVLAYTLNVKSFDKFVSAIWYAEKNLVGRNGCTQDFGRAPSVRNSVVEEDDDDNVLVSNVRLQEVEDFPIDILLQQSVDVEK